MPSFRPAGGMSGSGDNLIVKKLIWIGTKLEIPPHLHISLTPSYSVNYLDFTDSVRQSASMNHKVEYGRNTECSVIHVFPTDLLQN